MSLPAALVGDCKLLDPLVTRANAASKAVGRHMVTLVAVLAYLLAVAFWPMASTGESSTIAGIRLPAPGLFVGGVLVLVVVYIALQAMLLDLSDSLTRFDLETGKDWKELPANRILAPSFVVFAWYGKNRARQMSYLACNALAPAGLTLVSAVLALRPVIRPDNLSGVNLVAAACGCVLTILAYLLYQKKQRVLLLGRGVEWRQRFPSAPVWWL